MVRMATEPTYVLVIRLWYEPGAAVRVRMRGQTSLDGDLTFDRAASAPEDVLAGVREWLAAVTAP